MLERGVGRREQGDITWGLMDSRFLPGEIESRLEVLGGKTVTGCSVKSSPQRLSWEHL